MDETTDEMLLGEQAERLAELVSRLAETGGNNVQTVIHRTEGPTPWLAAAIAVMFCTLFFLLLFAAWVIPNLHDLQAWQQIHEKRINKLETK